MPLKHAGMIHTNQPEAGYPPCLCLRRLRHGWGGGAVGGGVECDQNILYILKELIKG